MKKVLKIGFCLLLAAVVLALTACPQEVDNKKTDTTAGVATLQSITVAGKPADSLGTPHAYVDDVEPGVIYLAAADLTGSVVATPTVSKATVSYAFITDIDGVPDDEDFEAAPGALANGGVLWVKVVSSNNNKTLYYAVVVYTRAALSVLNLTRTPGTARAVALGKPAETWNGVADDDVGELLVGTNELAGKSPLGVAGLALSFSPVPASNLTVKYAFVQGTAEPNFVDASALLWTTVASADWLYVSSARTGSDIPPLFYKIKLTVKNDSLELASLTLNTEVVTLAAANFGATFAAATAVVKEFSTSPVNKIVDYVAETEADTTTILYSITASSAAPTWADKATTGTTIPSGSTLGLELTSELGDKGYYRVQVVYGSDATTITGITVGGQTVTLEDAGTLAPLDDIAETGQFSGDIGDVYLTLAQSTTTTIAVNGLASGATVEYTWGINLNDDYFAKIDEWNTTQTHVFAGGTITIPSIFGNIPTVVAAGPRNAVIYVRVTSERGTSSDIYAIRVRVELPNDTGLSSVTVGGVAATLVNAGYYDTTAGWAFVGSLGTVELSAAEAGDGSSVKVIATGEHGVGIKYAFGFMIGDYGPYPSSGSLATADNGWANNINGEGLFFPDGLSIDVDAGFFVMTYVAEAGVHGAIIFIEVTSAYDANVTAIYAIRCTVEGGGGPDPNLPVISGLTIGGAAVTLVAPGSVDDTSGQFTGTAASIQLTTAQASGTVVVVASGATQGATVEYTWGTSYAGNLFAKTDDWSSSASGLFDGGDIDVTSLFGPATITVPPGVDGAVVFVRVSNDAGSNIYAISCSEELPTDLALISVTVGGKAATLEAAGALDSTQGYSYSGPFGSVKLTTAEAGDGYSVVVTATGTGSPTITYAFGVWITAMQGNPMDPPLGPYPSRYALTGAVDNTDGTGLFAGADPEGDFFTYSADAGVDGAVIFIQVTSTIKPGKTAVYAIECSVGDGRDFTLELPRNTGQTGHQVLMSDAWLFNGGTITTGDVYKLEFDVVSDFALNDGLQVFLVDNSTTATPQQWWTELFSFTDLTFDPSGGIGTTTPVHASITMTATATASSNDVAANKLGFATKAETNGRTDPITLTITNFTLVKQ